MDSTMRLGIISDTHGDVMAWRRALEVWGQVDFIIHCGDVNYHGPKFAVYPGYDPMALSRGINEAPAPVLIAKGNGDSEVDELVLDVPLADPYLFCQLDWLRLLAHHGHRFGVSELAAMALKFGCQLAITGHTHRAKVEETEGVLIVNPGSAAYGDRTVGLVEATPERRLLPSIMRL
ncbi:MAG: phosphodiesterase [Chloroflexi bacterium]|nr:phosphodiesterase [Chloroflexota bacterium]